MYRVFGDESSDVSKKRVFAVGAVFGSPDDWKSVEERWLKRNGSVPFHGTDCEANRGDFKNNTDAENKALYKDNVQIICKSNLMGEALAMDIAAWRGYFPEVPSDIPYLACFRNVIHRCANLALLAVPQDKVEFIFDNREETEFNATLLYQFMSRLKHWDGSDYVHDELKFANRHNCIGIQIADIVAREAMKDLDNRVGPVKRNPRQSMLALRHTNRFRFVFHEKEYFDDISKWQIGGFDPNAYRMWLTEKGLVDNISNRQHYLFVALPPEKLTLESLLGQSKQDDQ